MSNITEYRTKKRSRIKYEIRKERRKLIIKKN